MDKPFPAYDGTEPYFFVSYDHGDSEVVYPEMSWIRASGFNLWYDEGIHVGTVWRQALADALSRCAGFIFFSTAQSNHSDNCLKEINFALDEGKPVFVVQLDDSGLPPILRLSLSDRQALIKSAYDEDSYQSRLQSALGTVVEPKPAIAASEVPVDRNRINLDPPNVAVMPLTCTSGDAPLAELTEGLTEDLLAVLTRSNDWSIPGRASDRDLEPEEVGRLRNVRYLLSGGVRRRGPDVRVTMKLVATADGQIIWSQWYDRPYEAFYKYQDALIAAIDGILIVPVMLAEGARAADRPIEELDGFALLCRAWNDGFNHRISEDTVALCERAVAIDPEHAMAHAVLGIVLSLLITSASSQDPERDSARAVEQVDQALALNPNYLPILGYACGVHGRHGNETLAIKLAEQATHLGGKPHRYHYLVLIAAGRSEEVFELAQRDGSPPPVALALADLLAERWEEAVERFETAATGDLRDWEVWSYLANALAMVDRLDEARDAVARVKAIRQDWTLDLWEHSMRLSWRNREEIVEATLWGLRKLEVD